jgi:hypothetical protein
MSFTSAAPELLTSSLPFEVLNPPGIHVSS